MISVLVLIYQNCLSRDLSTNIYQEYTKFTQTLCATDESPLRMTKKKKIITQMWKQILNYILISSRFIHSVKYLLSAYDMISTILSIEHTAMNKNSFCLQEVFILEGDIDNKKQTQNEVNVMLRNGKFLKEKISRVGGYFYRHFVK